MLRKNSSGPQSYETARQRKDFYHNTQSTKMRVRVRLKQPCFEAPWPCAKQFLPRASIAVLCAPVHFLAIFHTSPIESRVRHRKPTCVAGERASHARTELVSSTVMDRVNTYLPRDGYSDYCQQSAPRGVDVVEVHKKQSARDVPGAHEPICHSACAQSRARSDPL
jgi:hypothetical protein